MWKPSLAIIAILLIFCVWWWREWHVEVLAREEAEPGPNGYLANLPVCTTGIAGYMPNSEQQHPHPHDVDGIPTNQQCQWPGMVTTVVLEGTRQWNPPEGENELPCRRNYSGGWRSLMESHIDISLAYQRTGKMEKSTDNLTEPVPGGGGCVEHRRRNRSCRRSSLYQSFLLVSLEPGYAGWDWWESCSSRHLEGTKLAKPESDWISWQRPSNTAV